MGVFYHVSDNELIEGTVLIPRYGQIVNNPDFFTRNNHDYSLHLKEMLFEKVREDEFSTLPSRVRSIYLTSSYDDAKKYKNITQGKKYIYKVEIEHPNRATTVDMRWMDLSNLQHYEVVKEFARNYYNGKSIDDHVHWGIFEHLKGKPEKPKTFWEVLYEGPVTIKKRL